MTAPHRRISSTAGLALLLATVSYAQPASQPTIRQHGPVPAARHLNWHAMEFYAFVHFGVNTFTDREWGDGRESPALFNPTQLDCRQWARVCREAGMKGIIITAKHHDGFCLWPTKLTEHCVRNSPWKEGKGDVLRELSDACREAGLKMGVYVSPWDRNSPHYGDSDRYNEFFRGQLREVLTSYGEQFEVWFDGACGESPSGRKQVYDWAGFIATVREQQPGAVIFSDVGPDVRWVGNEKGFAGETNWSFLKTRGHGRGADNPPPTRSLNEGDRDADDWIPAECDVSIRPGWFYHPAEDGKVKSVAELEEIYYKSVGRNAALLLNLPVDRRGLVHENDAAALAGLGRRIRETFANDLARSATIAPADAGGLIDLDPRTAWMGRTAGPQCSIELTWDREVEFDVIELREPRQLGQRVESFEISVPPAGEGKHRTLASGTTIGGKRLLLIEPVRTRGLRITLLKARAAPALDSIGVFKRPAADARR